MNIFKDLDFGNTVSSIISNENSYSYAQLYDDSKKFSSIANGRLLAFILSKNLYDCLVGYCGLLRGNVVVALINDTIHESIFNDIVLKFKPALIYQPKRYFQVNNSWDLKLAFGEYGLYKTNFEMDYKINDDLSMLLMTSGSTGSPEFVKLSYSNISSNTKAICNYLNIKGTDVAITTLPMSYSYGISIINTHLYSAANLILTDASLMEKKFWKIISNYKVTTFGGVPYTFEILKKLKYEDIPLSNITYITQAGGKLRNDLLEYFWKSSNKKNIDFVVMYGQTEASPRMSYLPPNMLRSKLGSIGIPIPGGKFYLIDDKERVLEEANVEGELVYDHAPDKWGAAALSLMVEHDMITEESILDGSLFHNCARELEFDHSSPEMQHIKNSWYLIEQNNGVFQFKQEAFDTYD